MKKILFLSILLFAIPSYGGNYEVQSVRGNSAIMTHKGSSQNIEVMPGDQLADGWTVFSVNKDSVVIEKCLNEYECTRGILPVNNLKFKRK